MNGMMNCIFNKHMRFEINEHYNPKHLELLKKLERPLPELDESDALFDEDLMLKILDQENMLDDDM